MISTCAIKTLVLGQIETINLFIRMSHIIYKNKRIHSMCKYMKTKQFQYNIK